MKNFTPTLLVSIFTISTLTATPEKPTLFDSLKNTYEQNKVAVHIGAGLGSLYAVKKIAVPAFTAGTIIITLATTKGGAGVGSAVAAVVIPVVGAAVAAPAGFGVWNLYKGAQEILKQQPTK